MGSSQRGTIVAKNDSGTLEHISGSRTFVGSATIDGKVVTKRFRGSATEQNDVIRRWEKWQCRKNEEPEEMEDNMSNFNKETCPFSGAACGAGCPLYSVSNKSCALLLGGVGLFNISCNMMKLEMSEPLELIAMAIADQSPRNTEKDSGPTTEQGVESFLSGKTFLSFINLTSKSIFGDYKRSCEEHGFPTVCESELSAEIASRYPEIVKKGVRGGSMFVAA